MNTCKTCAHWQMTSEQARTRALNEAIITLERRFMGDLNREDMEVKRCIDALVNLRDSTP